MHVGEIGKAFGAHAVHLCDRGLVGDLHLVMPAHSDGLQVLAAHHGAHARAAVGAIGHIHDGCKAYHLLTARPHLGNFDLRIAEFLLDQGFGSIL